MATLAVLAGLAVASVSTPITGPAAAASSSAAVEGLRKHYDDLIDYDRKAKQRTFNRIGDLQCDLIEASRKLDTIIQTMTKLGKASDLIPVLAQDKKRQEAVIDGIMRELDKEIAHYDYLTRTIEALQQQKTKKIKQQEDWERQQFETGLEKLKELRPDAKLKELGTLKEKKQQELRDKIAERDTWRQNTAQSIVGEIVKDAIEASLGLPGWVEAISKVLDVNEIVKKWNEIKEISDQARDLEDQIRRIDEIIRATEQQKTSSAKVPPEGCHYSPDGQLHCGPEGETRYYRHTRADSQAERSGRHAAVISAGPAATAVHGRAASQAERGGGGGGHTTAASRGLGTTGQPVHGTGATVAGVGGTVSVQVPKTIKKVVKVSKPVHVHEIRIDKVRVDKVYVDNIRVDKTKIRDVHVDGHPKGIHRLAQSLGKSTTRVVGVKKVHPDRIGIRTTKTKSKSAWTHDHPGVHSIGASRGRSIRIDHLGKAKGGGHGIGPAKKRRPMF